MTVEAHHRRGNRASVTTRRTIARARVPRADRFGRMFLDLPAFAAAGDQARAALVDLGRVGGPLDARDHLAVGAERLFVDPAHSLGNRDNPFQMAGTTYLGQWIDHDLTYDVTSRLGIPASPESTPNGRTPALDLDCLYGGGPDVDPHLYEADGVRLRVGSGARFEDLPRAADGTALIADPRNDDNLIVAGLHAAFALAHNQVVDRLRPEGRSRLFERARQVLTWHYQWLVLHEFLPRIVGHGVVQDILGHGRRWYRPEPGPAFIPVEFQGAAYRFGHSMVRPSYRVHAGLHRLVYDPAGGPDLRGGPHAGDHHVGWEAFFAFGDGQARPNKRIDRRISTPLFHIPVGPPHSLPQRNLLRHLTWSLPAGQAVARELGVPTLRLPELCGYGWEHASPLWYYVLAEAELLCDGILLGPVGARIVAEVLIGLLQLDPRGYLRTQPSWRPTLPRARSAEFQMTDLLRLAGVDPAARLAAGHDHGRTR